MVAVPVRIVGVARGDDLLDASLSLANTQLVGQLADETDLGPDPFVFHATYASRPSHAARKQLLADLGTAYARNVRRHRAKQRALQAALVALMLGVLASAAVFSIDHHSTIGSPHEHRQAHT